MKRRVVLGLPSVLGLLASVALLLVAIASVAGAPEGMRVRDRLGDWPFVTPNAAVKTIAIPGGGTMNIDANTCRGCHPDNYREWSSSTHRHALKDPQYIAELAKASSPRWLCLNCHIPNANQRSQLVDDDTRVLSSGHDLRTIDERANPDFDRKLQHEGITCASCHVRPGADGRGVIIGPRGDTKGPHVVREDRELLRNVCVSCHSPGPAQLTPTFVCWFETAEELAAGPYADKKDCVDCHMPEVERPIAPGYAKRTTRQHHWLGGGVPKTFKLYDQLLDHGWKPGLEVRTTVASASDITVELTNAHAGHKIPTADPERHFLVRARLLDGAGAEVARATTRIGQRWDWGDDKTGRKAHRVEDTRLGPQQTKTWRPKLAAAAKATTLVVDALHVRLSPENARYAKQAKIDDELEKLAPGSRKRISELQRFYPLVTFVAGERFELATKASTRESLKTLLERSKELRGSTLDEIERILRPAE